MVQASSALVSLGFEGLSVAQQRTAATPGAAPSGSAAADDAAPVFMRVQLQVNGKRYPTTSARQAPVARPCSATTGCKRCIATHPSDMAVAMRTVQWPKSFRSRPTVRILRRWR